MSETTTNTAATTKTKKAVIARKETVAAVVTKDLRDLGKVTVEENEQNTKLSQPAFLTLCFLNYDQKPNRSESDQEFLDNTHLVITPEVQAELIRKGVAEEVDGKLQITKFGTKWALQSQAFGQNFDSMVKGLNFNAKIKLLFNLVDNINDSLQDKIRVIGKEDKPSQLWIGLDGIAKKIAGWLEQK